MLILLIKEMLPPAKKKLRAFLTVGQWRIQDFPDRGANLKGGRGINLLFGQIFSKECMKMKKF